MTTSVSPSGADIPATTMERSQTLRKIEEQRTRRAAVAKQMTELQTEFADAFGENGPKRPPKTPSQKAGLIVSTKNAAAFELENSSTTQGQPIDQQPLSTAQINRGSTDESAGELHLELSQWKRATASARTELETLREISQGHADRAAALEITLSEQKAVRSEGIPTESLEGSTNDTNAPEMSERISHLEALLAESTAQQQRDSSKRDAMEKLLEELQKKHLVAEKTVASLTELLVASEQEAEQLGEADQIEILKVQLAASEEARASLQGQLRAAQQKPRPSTPPEVSETSGDAPQIAALTERLAASENARAELQSQMNAAAAAAAAKRRRSVTETSGTAPQVAALNQQLVASELETVSLRDQLTASEKKLEKQQKSLKLFVARKAAGLPSDESATNRTLTEQGDESDMVARLKEVIEGLQGQLAAADESVLSAQQRKAQVDNEKAELEEQLLDSQDSFAALSELLESVEEVNMVMERQCHHLQNQVDARLASGSGDEAAQLRIEVAEALELVTMLTSKLEISEEMLQTSNPNISNQSRDELDSDASNQRIQEMAEEYDQLKKKKRESDRKGGVMMGRLNDAHSTIALVSKQLQDCQKREDVLKNTIEQLESELEELDPDAKVGRVAEAEALGIVQY